MTCVDEHFLAASKLVAYDDLELKFCRNKGVGGVGMARFIGKSVWKKHFSAFICASIIFF